jgi:predicted acetyltransferase
MEIRFLTEAADIDRAMEVFWTALVGFDPPAGDRPVTDYSEAGRTLVVLDGDEPVGTAGSFTSWLVVPGGQRVPHAAVTDVGVLPTHTRRGIAGRLMSAQLEDFARRGEIVATLRASEAGIYERFGYGVAGRAHAGELSLSRTRFRPGVPAGGPVRLVPYSPELLAPVYERAATWPGAIARPPYWWRTTDLFRARDGGRSYVALHGAPGQEDGFVRYRSDRAWGQDGVRALVVDDLVAVGPDAWAGLLRYLAGVDLATRLTFGALPADHALPYLLLDERAFSTTDLWDEIWLRLVDVPAALAARTYGEGSVRLGVRDRLRPANDGVYDVSASGASRSPAEPELSLDVSALGAAYLGGTPFGRLALGGRIAEHVPGAVARADRLFLTGRAPFAGTFF